ncbi:MAG: RNA polymerase sigma factor [Syntrophobacteraceae bacterium]
MQHQDEGLLDSEIIRRVTGGDVNAFETLIGRYNRLVFGIVSKHLPEASVEDVAQDVFVEAFRSLKSFSEKSPFSHWISKIAVRCCYDFWRKRRKDSEVPICSLSGESQDRLDVLLASRSREIFERDAAKKEAAEVLEYALGKLSANDRMVLTLVHLEGSSLKEAADLLGWNIISVKVHAHRSRQRLRKVISQLLEH